MLKNLLLVDYENKQNIDLSSLDGSYSAIIFVGNLQNESKIKKRIDSNNKFVRINYLKVNGYGKNSLDFHIAFKLGQIFETEPETNCFILSADQGFDPLLNHLIESGLSCKRVESISDLPIKKPAIKFGLNLENPELTVCARCKTASTIEHNGGRWCTHCGRFASPPDTRITSNFIEKANNVPRSIINCSNCHQKMTTGDGVYDDGVWLCFDCLSQ